MIAHIDGDAFFASVYQATHPDTKGLPVVVGRERGIATAFSYEAKARGVSYILVPKWQKSDFPYQIRLDMLPVAYEDARYKVFAVE